GAHRCSSSACPSWPTSARTSCSRQDEPGGPAWVDDAVMTWRPLTPERDRMDQQANEAFRGRRTPRPIDEGGDVKGSSYSARLAFLLAVLATVAGFALEG